MASDRYCGECAVAVPVTAETCPACGAEVVLERSIDSDEGSPLPELLATILVTTAGAFGMVEVLLRSADEASFWPLPTFLLGVGELAYRWLRRLQLGRSHNPSPGF